MSVLFLDLETTVSSDKITEKEIEEQIPGNYKKPESRAKFLAENKDLIIKKIIKKRSLDPFLCKVICLSYSFNGEAPKALIGTECSILAQLEDCINKHLADNPGPLTGISLVGHNIKKFDAPILFIRACKFNNHTIKDLLYFSRKSIIDTIELASFFVFNQLVSLDTLCTYFDIPTPKDKMDGSMVYQYHKDGRINEIAEYCNKDVSALAQLYNYLKIS